MIVSGDYIEMSIGLSLGIGTMTAAALGNIIADVIGLNLGGMIEEASHRYAHLTFMSVSPLFFFLPSPAYTNKSHKTHSNNISNHTYT